MDPKTRQRQLAAQKARRRAARDAERRRRRNRWLVVGGAVGGVGILAGALFVAAPWDDDSDGDGSDTEALTVSCNYLQPPVQGSAEAARPVELPPESDVPATGTTTATLQYNSGTVTVALDRTQAPCAVNSFVSLSSQGYFDDTPCHRLTTGQSLQVLQCGDPTGTGTGGPGYSFTTETPLNVDNAYTRGTLAMANSGTPDSNGSQFFIVYGDSQLPPDYTVFGTVTSGIEVVDAIAAAGTADGGEDGAPKNPVTLQSVAVG